MSTTHALTDKPIVAPLPPDSSPTSISIASITQRIAGKIHELTKLGRLTVHCQWIRPQANTGASRFFSVTLADTKTSDVSIQAFIWDYATISKILAEGERLGMNLAARDARCEVILDATIDCWTKQGKPYLRIHTLNEIGMRGLKHQQREAALTRLEADGDLTRNRQRPWKRATLRLALLTKPGSAACEDALSIIRHSRYAITTTLFPVAVQGLQAESTIVAAFTTLAARYTDFDAVLLIRGGGGELDLAAYDLYPVARAIAHCPIPVITGLGHHIDQSVCDLAAYHAVETPTAAAHYVIAQLDLVHTQLLDTYRTILTQMTRQAVSVHTQMQTLTKELIHHAFSTIQSAQRTLLTTSSRTLHVYGPAHLQRARRQLQTSTHAVHDAVTQHILAPAQRTLRRLPREIQRSIQIVLGHHQQSMTKFTNEIDALDPTRLLALGYALVTGLDGHVIHAPDTLTPKHRIKIHFLHHTITATITNIKPRHLTAQHGLGIPQKQIPHVD